MLDARPALPLNMLKNYTCQFDTLSESQAYRVPQPQQVVISCIGP